MTHERIPVEGWQDQRGHVERYEWVRQFLGEWDDVLDVCCGIGYGAKVLDIGSRYRGVDKEPADMNLIGEGWFTLRNVNHEDWLSDLTADVVIAFEAIEHIADPVAFCTDLAWIAVREIFVSVPVIPTKEMNEHHLHDFTVEDIPPMFPGWRVADEWAQPREFSHVWRFVRV
jgi:hypothetical protein